ncbi:unnamed protein product [Trifolium pratense]|uniref:Uncharacterized protein n=1 Tax=Trifolium pratense TaxID=57577 RepID=A0ACB0KJK2_TRIPR|nr:unnamed protein product [Trifolium pratense]
MALSNPLFDAIRSNSDVDPPQVEESIDVGELMNDPAQTAPKPDGILSSIHCKPRVHNRCPTSRHELGNIRCLALEKVASSFALPCKYKAFGCIGIYPYYDKSERESQCSYRPYNCPYAGSQCSIVGDISYLVNHLKEDQKVDMHNGSTFNHRYVKSNPHEVENATWMLTVFSCYGQYFCLHFETFQLGAAPVYIAFLRFMGDDSEAKKKV